MVSQNMPTPAALDAGIPIRDLDETERAAMLQAAARYTDAEELIEIADALGLCGDPGHTGAYMATSAGNARLSPDFGSQSITRR